MCVLYSDNHNRISPPIFHFTKTYWNVVKEKNNNNKIYIIYKIAWLVSRYFFCGKQKKLIKTTKENNKKYSDKINLLSCLKEINNLLVEYNKKNSRNLKY